MLDLNKYQFIAGIDEVGRGPLAGPVTAAVVCLKKENYSILSKIKGIKDSKQLTKRQRENIFERIKDIPEIKWKTSFVCPKVIDKINIWQATLLAWQRCLKKLEFQPNFLFLDGKMIIPRLKIEQEAIIKGDQKIPLLSLASIIAKVSRDKLMEKLSRKYPEYGFIDNKGYGTRFHLEKLKKYGPCSIHRKSFKPVFDNLSFSDKVYYITSQIPKGEVMTYKQVAEKIGCPGSCRAVGNVLNKNNDYKIPCHRVICSDGKSGGYNKGEELKKKLLEKERRLS